MGRGKDYLCCISSVLILNTIHRCFQKELHGMTSTNPPPQGKDRMADEWADGGMAAVQMHSPSGRLMQVTTPAVHMAQLAHLAECCAGYGSKGRSLMDRPPLASPSSTRQQLPLSASPGLICSSVPGNPKGLAALTGRSPPHLNSNCFFLSSCHQD